MKNIAKRVWCTYEHIFVFYSIECGGTLSALHGAIEYPRADELYAHNANCS